MFFPTLSFHPTWPLTDTTHTRMPCHHDEGRGRSCPATAAQEPSHATMPCTWTGYGEPLPRLPINTGGKNRKQGGAKFWRRREANDRFRGDFWAERKIRTGANFWCEKDERTGEFWGCKESERTEKKPKPTEKQRRGEERKNHRLRSA